MKAFAAVVAAASLLAGGGVALASGPLGPPEPELFREKTALSAGYERDATKWKSSNAAFGDVSVAQSRAYLQFMDSAVSFGERGAGFIRAGAADFDDGASFQDGYKPFLSLGMKDTWYGGRKSTFTVGTVFLATYCPGYKAETRRASGATVKAKIKNQMDIMLGIAAEKRLRDKLAVYGGPLLLYERAKVTREGGGTDGQTTYKEKSPVGLFGGVALTLSKKLIVFAEAQFRGELSAGAAITWSFD